MIEKVESSKRLVYLICLIVIIWIGLWALIGVLLDDYDGTGDVFSAINSLFSALAFAVIIYTIKL